MTTQASSSDLPATTAAHRRFPRTWLTLVAPGVIGLALVCGLAFAQEGTDVAMLAGLVFIPFYGLVATGVWLAYRLVRDLHRLGRLHSFLGFGIPLFLAATIAYAVWRANNEQAAGVELGHLVGGLAFASGSLYWFGRFLKRR